MDVGKVLKNGWDLFVKDIGPLIVAGLIPFAIMLVALVPAYLVFLVPIVVSSNRNNGTASAAAAVGGAVLLAVVAIVATLLTIPFYGAIVKMILRRVREGRAPQYGDVWACWSQWGSLVGAAVLVGLAVAVGFVLLIIPGIFLAIMFCLVFPVIVDRRVGPVEAMRLSWRLVMGAGFWTVLLNLFIVGIIAGFASQIPFAGILVLPWELAAITAMYLMAAGDERLLPSSFPGPSSAWQGGEPPQYPPYGAPGGFGPYGAPGGFVPYGPPPGAPYGDPQPYAAGYGPPPPPPPWAVYPAPTTPGGQPQPQWQSQPGAGTGPQPQQTPAQPGPDQASAAPGLPPTAAPPAAEPPAAEPPAAEPDRPVEPTPPPEPRPPEPPAPPSS